MGCLHSCNEIVLSLERITSISSVELLGNFKWNIERRKVHAFWLQTIKTQFNYPISTLQSSYSIKLEFYFRKRIIWIASHGNKSFNWSRAGFSNELNYDVISVIDYVWERYNEVYRFHAHMKKNPTRLRKRHQNVIVKSNWLHNKCGP